MSKLKVFTGSAHPALAQMVVDRLGVPLGKAKVSTFSDGECAIELLEDVRGKDVFIIQPTCAPTNTNLMELILMADAMRRASAARVTAVVPYFGYARQDRRPRSARVPISARVVANMMARSGIDRVLTVDLHAEQIQGFFDIPVDNVFGSPVLLDEITNQDYDHPLVVSPDVGGVVRARAVAKQLDTDLAIIDKRREKANESQIMHIIGDVTDRTCILVDDMCDTAGTLCKAADAMRRASAARVTAVVPYFGYARQDRRPRSARVPISARVVANMMARSGIDRVLTVDLHAEQIQGFFDIPVDNVFGSPVLLDEITNQDYDHPLVVSPDVGGVVRARAVAKQLDTDLAIIDKRREKANESQIMHIIGDVTDRTCILVDDMCDTAGTLCKAADALKANGAKRVIAYATHPVLSGPAVDNIINSSLDELVVTDTIPLSAASKACGSIRQLTMADLLAESVRRVCNEESISAMFRT